MTGLLLVFCTILSVATLLEIVFDIWKDCGLPNRYTDEYQSIQYVALPECFLEIEYSELY